MSAGPDPIDPEMNRLADALAALAPARGPLDRDRILFAAGRAEGLRLAPRRRGWPALAACLALVASGEAALLLRGPSTHVIERVVVVREPAPASPRADPDPPVVLPASDPSPPRPWDSPGLGRTPRDRLAEQVLRYGLDGLPAPPPLIARDDPDPGIDGPTRSRIDPYRLLFAPGDPS